MGASGGLPGEDVVRAGSCCMAAGCTTAGAVRCAYRDSRERRCRSWWCARHSASAAGALHCRRHARLAALLAADPFPPPAPDVDSRAAALAAWMQAQLDAGCRSVLGGLAPRRGGSVVVDPLRLVTSAGRRERRWRSTWKLADQRGVLTSLAVEVREDRDDEVLASVDSLPVGQGVPPWIERRRIGSVLGPEQQESERRSFSSAIARSLELVATRRETAG
jgi:hypothetical protein